MHDQLVVDLVVGEEVVLVRWVFVSPLGHQVSVWEVWVCDGCLPHLEDVLVDSPRRVIVWEGLCQTVQRCLVVVRVGATGVWVEPVEVADGLRRRRRREPVD